MRIRFVLSENLFFCHLVLGLLKSPGLLGFSGGGNQLADQILREIKDSDLTDFRQILGQQRDMILSYIFLGLGPYPFFLPNKATAAYLKSEHIDQGKLRRVLKNIYKKLQIKKQWRSVLPHYRREIQLYQRAQAKRALYRVNRFLRYCPRVLEVQLCPSLFIGSGSAMINWLGPRLFIIFGPTSSFSNAAKVVSNFQHEYLHFLTEPLLKDWQFNGNALQHNAKMTETIKGYYNDPKKLFGEYLARALAGLLLDKSQQKAYVGNQVDQGFIRFAEFMDECRRLKRAGKRLPEKLKEIKQKFIF